MLNRMYTILAAVSLSTLMLATGCSSGREVEIKGQVQSAASEPVQVDVYEIATEDSKEDGDQIKSFKIEKVGDFVETVDVEKDFLRFVAYQDIDKDGKLSNGDPRGETRISVKDKDSVEIKLSLAVPATK